MNNRTVSDLDTNHNVRKILVRHQIDLGWLSHYACRGTVYIQGELLLLPGVSSALTPLTVANLFDEIGGAVGVCNMIIELRNWHHDSFNSDWQLVPEVVSLRRANGVNPRANAFEGGG